MMPRLSDVLPPFLTRTLLTRALGRSLRRDGLFGNFPDWASALAASKPYETDLTVYGKITDKARLGVAGSGRNLTPILAGLAIAFESGVNRVLDFGGNLGMVYFDVASVLPDRVLEWHVVDVQDVVNYGNVNYANDQLAFFTSVDSACRDFIPSLVLCSHTLQYLEKPYDALAMLGALHAAVIVLHELPVAERERFMIQRLPESLGGGERPFQILSSGKLATALSSYELIADIDLPRWDPYIDARHVAQVFQRRRP
jgi:putative methyltransferase (TIGR04325 family)